MLFINNDYEKMSLLDLELTAFAPSPHYQISCVARTLGLESDLMTEFINGYGLSKDEYLNLLPELKLLTTLGCMRGVGWSETKLPEYHNEYGSKARSLILEYYKGQLV